MQRDAFNAVADPTRRRILELLRNDERSAGDIAARFRVSWPAVSRHLRVLKQSGLIRARRAGREQLYTLNRARIRAALGSWLAALDTMGARNVERLGIMPEKTSEVPAQGAMIQGDGWREVDDEDQGDTWGVRR